MSETIIWSELTPRERDALVERKVFGHTDIQSWADDEDYVWLDHQSNGITPIIRVPHYTTDIAAAFEVSDKFESISHIKMLGGGWACVIERYETMRSYRAKAKALPVAICVAALRAVGLQVITSKE